MKLLQEDMSHKIKDQHGVKMDGYCYGAQLKSHSEVTCSAIPLDAKLVTLAKKKGLKQQTGLEDNDLRTQTSKKLLSSFMFSMMIICFKTDTETQVLKYIKKNNPSKTSIKTQCSALTATFPEGSENNGVSLKAG